MKDFLGKTAFITGGAKGIGLAMATVFAREGMSVVIGDMDNDQLDEAESKLRQISNHILAINVDVTDRSALENVSDQIRQRFGPLHVLCNNAGIGGGQRVLETPDDMWRRVEEVNFWGPINGIKVFLPDMLGHGENGHIVNTASFSGIEGHGHQSAYGASKFAVVGLSEFLSNDLADTSISVSVLCPHVVDTPILDSLKSRLTAEHLKLLEKMAVPSMTVAEQVLSAIKQQEFYVFCDGNDTRKMLEKRSEKLLGAMNRQFPKGENA